MTKYLKLLDSKILNLVTKFCHWFQKLTGYTNYFLAGVVVMFISISVFLTVLNYWLNLKILSPLKTSPLFMLIYLILLFGLFLLKNKLDEEDQRIRSGDDVLRKNWEGERGSRYLNRLLFIFMMIYVNFSFFYIGGKLFGLIDVIFFSSYAFFEYLMIVIPLPPGKSKIKEWATSISAFFARMLPATSAGK